MHQHLKFLTLAPKKVKTLIQIIFDTAILSGILLLLASNLASTNVAYNLYLIIGASFSFSAIMYLAKIYRSFVRFFTLGNMGKIFILVSALYIFIGVVGAFKIEQLQILSIFFVTTFSLLVLPRVVLRELLGTVPSVDKLRVAVLGNEFESYELFDLLKRSKKFQPRSFILDDHEISGMTKTSLNQIPLSRFIKNQAKYKIDVVVIPKDLLERRGTKHVIEQLEPLGIPLLKSSGIDNLFKSNGGDLSLVPLSLTDLTSRKVQAPIHKLISRNIAKKIVLVTGGGGSIGSEICSQVLSGKPKKLIVLDYSEYNLYQIEQKLSEINSIEALEIDIEFVLCSILDGVGMSSVFENNDIEVIYHAAAFKHVPLVEMNPLVSFENNVTGTNRVCELAIEFQVPSFTLISTDKAVNPTNFMGVTKRLAEMLCQAFGANQDTTKFSIVRFGNVLGSSGSVIPKFEKQIKSGGPITVTHQDINRYFMSIPEAAQLVIQASAMAKGGDVFILDMGQPIKIMDLAKRLCSLRGLSSFCLAEGTFSGDIEIKITGLRVGEKLYEELLVSDNAEVTEHPRIYSAREVFIHLEQFCQLTDELRNSLLSKDEKKLQTIFSQLKGLNYPDKNMLEFCSRL